MCIVRNPRERPMGAEHGVARAIGKDRMMAGWDDERRDWQAPATRERGRDDVVSVDRGLHQGDLPNRQR